LLLDFFKRLTTQRGVNEKLYSTIEEVVDIADPAIRRASRYRKKLCSPVQTAQDYCSSMIESVPGPVRLDRNNYFNDPRVKALFASPEQMEELLRYSPEINILRKNGYSGEAVALLTMTKHEKTVLGHQKMGELIMRDVAQQTVDFTDHSIIAPSANVGSAKVGIVKRGVEVLATVAMERITNLRTTISELRQKRDYLSGVIKIKRGRSRIQTSFSLPDPILTEEVKKAKDTLASVEDELQEALKDLSYPEDSLRYLIEIIQDPSRLVAVDSHSIFLNWMNVLVDKQSDIKGNEIVLAEFTLMEDIKRYGVFVVFTLEERDGHHSVQ
jgi:hypothetical protein